MAIENKNVVIYGKEIVDEKLEAKQDVLVSGENIKTINGQSVLGEGDIEITGGSGGDVPFIKGQKEPESEWSDTWGNKPDLGYVIKNRDTYFYYSVEDTIVTYTSMGKQIDNYIVASLYLKEIASNLTEDCDVLSMGGEILRYQYNNGQPKVVVALEDGYYNYNNYLYLRSNLSDGVTREIDLTDENLEYVYVYVNSSYLNVFNYTQNTLKAQVFDFKFVTDGYYYDVNGIKNYLLTNNNAGYTFATQSWVTDKTSRLEYSFRLMNKRGYEYGISRDDFNNKTQPTDLYITREDWNKISRNSYLDISFMNTYYYCKIINIYRTYSQPTEFYCIINRKDATVGDVTILLSAKKSSTINSDSNKINFDVSWYQIGEGGGTVEKQNKLVINENLKSVSGIILSQDSSGNITIGQNLYYQYNSRPNNLGWISPESSDNAVYLSEALANPSLYINEEERAIGPGEYVPVKNFRAELTQQGSPIWVSSDQNVLMRFTSDYYSDVWELQYNQVEGYHRLQWFKNGSIATMTEWGAWFYMEDVNSDSQNPSGQLFDVIIDNNSKIKVYYTEGRWTMTRPSNSDLPKVIAKESGQFAPYYNTSDGNKSFLLTKDNFINVAYDKSQVDNKLTDKQNKLVSGNNIKTLNGQSLLGSGNILTEWIGTQEEYDAIETKDPNITYYITEE